MGIDKKHRKLLKLTTKAQNCSSREKAQKIIKKADRVYSKLSAKEIN